MTQPDALAIITRWMEMTTDPEKRKILFVIQDMIYGDLEYTSSPDIVKTVKSFLDAGNHDNSDLKKIREFIGL